MSIHAATASKSARLRRMFDALNVRNGRTTAELQRLTGSMAPHTDVSELRANGIRITCTNEGMRAGRRIFRYRLAALARKAGRS